MSKFQVGDKVVHREIKRSEGEVVNIQADGRLVLRSGGALVHDCRPENFELADPHVLDRDGNPIRVGQLVERVTEVPGEIRRVRNLADGISSYPEPLIMVEGRSGWFVAEQWRVLTADDLLCRPRSDTQDVTLRVTFRDSPSDIPAGGLINDVAGALEHFGLVDFTVEVVDDGGHDDG